MDMWYNQSMQKINFKDCVKTYFKNSWWKLIVIFAIVAVDLVSKALIVPQDESLWVEVPIIGDLIVISPTRNIGAGFSILSGKTVFLIVLTVIFILGLTTFDVLSKKTSKLYIIASGLIMAGAIGNFVDRVLFGYVRDFIYFKFINFPVFNVADISLTFGVVVLLVYIIFFSSKKDGKSVPEVQKTDLFDDAQKTDLENGDKISEESHNKKVFNETLNNSSHVEDDKISLLEERMKAIDAKQEKDISIDTNEEKHIYALRTKKRTNKNEDT